MENLIGYTEEEFEERFSKYTCQIDDSLDLAFLLNMHNFCDDDKVLIYKDFIEVYQCDLWVEGNDDEDGYTIPAPFFDDNLFRMYPPMLDEDETPYIRIEFIDYGEDIDIKERNDVMAEIKSKFHFMFEGMGYIKFVSDIQCINWFFDDDDDEIFELD